MPVLLEAPPTSDALDDPGADIPADTPPPAPASVEADLAHLTALLAGHDIDGARAWSQELLRRWPDHPRAQHWAYVLTPPVARMVPARHRAHRRDQEMEWLRQHGAEYLNQWVVLFKDRLLAAGPDLETVLAQAREIPCDGYPWLVLAGPVPRR